MSFMFSFCSALKEINIPNLNINKITDINYMFNECSDELKMKIKNKYSNIRDEAFK